MNENEIDAALVINELRTELAEAHFRLAIARAEITQLKREGGD